MIRLSGLITLMLGLAAVVPALRAADELNLLADRSLLTEASSLIAYGAPTAHCDAGFGLQPATFEQAPASTWFGNKVPQKFAVATTVTLAAWHTRVAEGNSSIVPAGPQDGLPEPLDSYSSPLLLHPLRHVQIVNPWGAGPHQSGWSGLFIHYGDSLMGGPPTVEQKDDSVQQLLAIAFSSDSQAKRFEPTKEHEIRERLARSEIAALPDMPSWNESPCASGLYPTAAPLLALEDEPSEFDSATPVVKPSTLLLVTICGSLLFVWAAGRKPPRRVRRYP